VDLLEIKSNDVKEAWFIKIMCMLQREIEKQIYLEDGCKKKPCPRSRRECVGMTLLHGTKVEHYQFIVMRRSKLMVGFGGPVIVT
jgi:hypothetical protein